MKKTIKKIFIKFLRIALLTVSFPFMVLVFGIGIYCKCFIDLIMDKPFEE